MWVIQASFNACSCWRAYTLDLVSRINHLIFALQPACLDKAEWANDIPSNIQISITRYAVQAQGHMVRKGEKGFRSKDLVVPAGLRRGSLITGFLLSD